MTARLAASVAFAGAVCGAGSLTSVPAPPPADTPAAPVSFQSEYRYRVYGRVRLALFWTRGSLVGAARMSARASADGTELSFLLGSEPDRAAGGMNQWSYVREETNRTHASAFGVRTLSADDVVDRRGPAMPDDAAVGASCSFVDGAGIRSLLTTVNGTGVTYRMFDRILDHVARTPQWRMEQVNAAGGIRIGLLSAMAEDIRRGGADPAILKTLPPLTYLFDGRLYDLTVRDARTLGPAQVGATRFDRLTRIDSAIFNRSTRVVSRFSAAFDPGAPASLPVQVVFQPNFWIRVELRLDESADAPADPAADPGTLERIRALCAGAVDRVPQTATGRGTSNPRN
jgi:hypothetical protein